MIRRVHGSGGGQRGEVDRRRCRIPPTGTGGVEHGQEEVGYEVTMVTDRRVSNEANHPGSWNDNN